MAKVEGGRWKRLMLAGWTLVVVWFGLDGMGVGWIRLGGEDLLMWMRKSEVRAFVFQFLSGCPFVGFVPPKLRATTAHPHPWPVCFYPSSSPQSPQEQNRYALGLRTILRITVATAAEGVIQTCASLQGKAFYAYFYCSSAVLIWKGLGVPKPHHSRWLNCRTTRTKALG